MSLAKGAANKLAQNQGHVSVWDDAFNGGRPPTQGAPGLLSIQGTQKKNKMQTNPKFKAALQETLFKKKKFQDQRDLDYMQELQQDMLRKQQDEQSALMAQKEQTTGYTPKPTIPTPG